MRGSSVRYDSIERFDDGTIADQETGTVRGEEAELEWVAPTVSMRLRGARWRGDVAYRGRSQIGIPVATSTDLAWTETAVGADLAWWSSGDWSWGPSMEVGRRKVWRDIRPSFFSTALTEVIRQDYAGLGLAARWQVLPRLALRAWAAADRPLSTSLDVDFHGFADPATLAPDPRWSSNLALSLAARVTDTLGVELRWQRRRWRVGASPSVPYRVSGQATGSTVRYPGSEQRLDEILIGVRWKWP